MISLEVMEESTDDIQNVWVECPHCYTQFEHNLKYATTKHCPNWQFGWLATLFHISKTSCGKPRMSLV